jgi:hypothetical protein
LPLGARLEASFWSSAIVMGPCAEHPSSILECSCSSAQVDSNEDGVADCLSVRFGDFDLDGAVGPSDLAVVLSDWGAAQGSIGDLDGDGSIGAMDLAILLSRWGQSI